MAWAERLPNGNYRAFWRDSAGKRRSSSFDPRTHKRLTQRRHAIAVAGELEEAARRGETTTGRADTWANWCERWLVARVVEASTKRQDRVRIDRYLMPYWGPRRINTITRTQVQAWVNQLAELDAHIPARAGKVKPPRPLSPSTVDRILRLFSASMKAALLDETVPVVRNPCIGIKHAPAAPGHERFLTHGEAALIAYHLDEPYKSMWLLLLGTGMRFGELAGLHWQRVDLAEGLIHIIETWDSADRRIKAYPKSKKARAVPIADWIAPVLGFLYDRTGDQATCGLIHAGGARCRSGLVIPAPGGGALDAHNIGQRPFARAVQLADIGPTRLHDARHTFASWLRQDGVALEEIQRLLGHASLQTTQRYAHLGTSQHGVVLAALNRSPL